MEHLALVWIEGLAVAQLLGAIVIFEAQLVLIPLHAEIGHGVASGAGHVDFGRDLADAAQVLGDAFHEAAPQANVGFVVAQHILLDSRQQSQHLFFADLAGTADGFLVGTVVQRRGLDQILAAEEQA